ncbi:MAG: hypothetical protein RR922_04000 [Clostridia bacterium]
MNCCLTLLDPTIIFGFRGIYGVETDGTCARNYITEEMRQECADEIWILVEDNTGKQNVEYLYKYKCLNCGEILTLNEGEEIREGKVLNPKLSITPNHLISYYEVRNFATNLYNKYTSKTGKEPTTDFIYEMLIKNFSVVE